MTSEGDSEMGSIHDDDLGDVLVIRRDDLPTETAETAAGFLKLQRIPGILPSTITRARKAGELRGTVLAGQAILYARSDLLAWVQSRVGNSDSYFAAPREGLRGNQNARKDR